MTKEEFDKFCLNSQKQVIESAMRVAGSINKLEAITGIQKQQISRWKLGQHSMSYYAYLRMMCVISQTSIEA